MKITTTRAFFVGILLLLGSLANSDSGMPAVAGNEVKLEASGGSFDGTSLKGLEGSFVLPLSHRWGMQFDAAGNSLDDTDDDLESLGGGVHIFWRNPAKMLLDLHLSTLSSEDFDVSEAKFLAEFYWAATSLSLGTGIRFGDVADAVLGELLLTHYFGENISLNMGLQSIESEMAYGGGFNYRTPAKGLHLFGLSLFGDNNFDATLVGLRYYFGEHVSNQQRDRELIIQSDLFKQRFNQQPFSAPAACPAGTILLGESCVTVGDDDCVIS